MLERARMHRWICITLVQAACFYDAPARDAAYRCDAERACATGAHCEDGRCVAERASCDGLELPDSCGPDRDDWCCHAALLPEGTYQRGYDAASDGIYKSQTTPATLRPIRLDVYEVTVGRFEQFVLHGPSTRARPPAPGAGAHPWIPGSGWDAAWDAQLPETIDAYGAALETKESCPSSETFTVWSLRATAGGANRPINCTTWYEAMAFCAWDGGFLPTEAEWHHAASGTEQRAYPFSNPPSSLDITPANASFQLDNGTCTGGTAPGCGPDDLLPVGSLPAGVAEFGQYDLAGNVVERVVDTFDPDYPVPCTDCARLGDPALDRVIRGGGFTNRTGVLRSANRSRVPASERQAGIGFRCARPAYDFDPAATTRQ